MSLDNKAISEKKKIAFSSVIAAVFLTCFKFIIGISTGSLGILSEALHSSIDLIAALITLLAVRISDNPADDEHNYGHGKIENVSALAETLLLVLTCVWIIYEAIHRITTHHVKVEVTYWSFIVVVVSIIVDFTRSRALSRVAKKYKSQALEADALHFSTDIWSSSVVLIGLVGVAFHFQLADAISALIVAAIVFYISVRLGKKSFDALVDKAPQGLYESINQIIKNISEVKGFHNIRIREAGSKKFIELNIHVDNNLTIDEAHHISHKVESAIEKEIEDSEVMVHTEPEIENDL
jgi:cation diffusion facilitator family transporter